MDLFTFNGDLYIRVIPGKNLFKSTMVHEVVNRGDVFVIRVKDSLLTILDGKSEVEHRRHIFNKEGWMVEELLGITEPVDGE